jgi:hypothetical protein
MSKNTRSSAHGTNKLREICSCSDDCAVNAKTKILNGTVRQRENVRSCLYTTDKSIADNFIAIDKLLIITLVPMLINMMKYLSSSMFGPGLQV